MSELVKPLIPKETAIKFTALLNFRRNPTFASQGDENQRRLRGALHSGQRDATTERPGAAPASSKKPDRQCQGFDSIAREKSATICLNKAIALAYP
ncbi:hypothetical protein [Trinickia sp. YCB016]